MNAVTTILMALLLSVSVASRAMAQAGSQPPLEPHSRMIDLGGWHAKAPPRDRLPADAQHMRAWALGQVKHYAANDNSFDREELAAMIRQRQNNERWLGDTPLIVLTSGKPAHNAPDLEAERMKLQSELVGLSRCAKQVIVHHSEHHIQLEAPALVVQSIGELVDMLERRRSCSLR
jgi:hypothetical protein